MEVPTKDQHELVIAVRMYVVGLQAAACDRPRSCNQRLVDHVFNELREQVVVTASVQSLGLCQLTCHPDACSAALKQTVFKV
jgi:hypothetical protein